MPLTMAMAADPDIFAYYKGGVMEPHSKYCAPTLNHTVTIVGYQPEYQVDARKSSEDNQICRKRKASEDNYFSGCKYTDEFKKNVKYCCREQK